MASDPYCIIVLDRLTLEEVMTAIKSRFPDWWNHTGTSFVVRGTPGEVQAWASRVLVDLHGRDCRFLVIQLHPGEIEGYLPSQAWNWLRQKGLVQSPSTRPPGTRQE